MGRWRSLVDVIWSAGISISAGAGVFLLNVGLARVFDKGVFGEWGILQSTVTTVAGVAQLSMAVTATRYVARLRATDPARLGRVLGVCSFVSFFTGAVAAGGLALFAGPISATTFLAPHLAGALRLSCFYLFFLTVNGFQLGVLSGLHCFRPQAVLGAAYAAASVLLSLLGGSRFGLPGAVAGLALATLASWVAHHLVLRAACRRAGIAILYSGMSSELAILSDFAFPATLAGLVTSAATWLSNVILVRTPGGYLEMGELTAANTFKNVVLFAPLILTRVTLPRLVSRLGGADPADYAAAFSRSLGASTVASILVALPLLVFPREFLGLFGRSFQGAGAVVTIFCVVGVLEAMREAGTQHFLGAAWAWWMLAGAALRAFLIIGLSWLLAPTRGAGGVAAANVAGAAACLLFFHGILKARVPGYAPFGWFRQALPVRGS